MVRFLHCLGCGEKLAGLNVRVGRCDDCREDAAIEARRHWCVLTPHKQGPMFFTNNFAREAAKGINNKGGLVR
jgi:hypothetical protein